MIIDNIKHSGTMLSNILLYRKIEQKWINWTAKPVFGIENRFCTQNSEYRIKPTLALQAKHSNLLTTGIPIATCQTAGTTTPTGSNPKPLRLGRLIWTLNSVRISEYSSTMSCPIDILIKN